MQGSLRPLSCWSRFCSLAELSAAPEVAELGISKLLRHYVQLQHTLEQVRDATAAQVLLGVGGSPLSPPDLSPTPPFYKEVVEAGKLKISMRQTCIHMYMQSAVTLPMLQYRTALVVISKV